MHNHSFEYWKILFKYQLDENVIIVISILRHIYNLDKYDIRTHTIFILLEFSWIGCSLLDENKTGLVLHENYKVICNLQNAT